jgi:hypothetical protein
MIEIVEDPASSSPPLPKPEVEEGKSVSAMGSRQPLYPARFSATTNWRRKVKADVLRIAPESGLGILREPKHGGVTKFSELPAELRAIAREPRLLVLTKATCARPCTALVTSTISA